MFFMDENDGHFIFSIGFANELSVIKISVSDEIPQLLIGHRTKNNKTARIRCKGAKNENELPQQSVRFPITEVADTDFCTSVALYTRLSLWLFFFLCGSD